MKHQETTFAELIEKLKGKDETAVDELVKRYGSHILRVVRRHLGRQLRVRFDSQDFAQAVWATLFLKSSAFCHIQNEPQLIAFLTQIAFHKVIDERRANTLIQKRNLNREISMNPEDLQHHHAAITEETPSQLAIADEQLKRLQNELPADLHWMIECRIEGMTFDTIAEKGGLHERTVRRVFERLRRKLEN